MITVRNAIKDISHRCSNKTTSPGIFYPRQRHSPITAEIGSFSSFLINRVNLPGK